MKKILLVAIIQAVMLFFFSTVSMADGNKLLEQCHDTVYFLDTNEIRNELNIGLCFGSIQGVRVTIMIYHDYSPEHLKVCWPEENITNAQAARIIVKYLKDNPQILHEDDYFLTLKAYLDAYPCK